MADRKTKQTETERPAKILVVDDEEIIRTLEDQVLTKLGHEVIQAGDGEAAVALARERLPDLMLLDLHMPGLSGIDVCKSLRKDKKTRGIRIIVVTAMDSKSALEESLLAGADDFLEKPIDTLELSVRVRSMLRTRSIGDEQQWLEAYVRDLQKLRASRAKR